MGPRTDTDQKNQDPSSSQTTTAQIIEIVKAQDEQALDALKLNEVTDEIIKVLAEQGDEKAINFLIRKFPKCLDRVFYHAAAAGKEELTLHLMQDHRNIDFIGKALKGAVFHGHVKLMYKILNNYKSIATNTTLSAETVIVLIGTAVRYAAYVGNKELVIELINQLKGENTLALTALVGAMDGKHVELINHLTQNYPNWRRVGLFAYYTQQDILASAKTWFSKEEDREAKLRFITLIKDSQLQEELIKLVIKMNPADKNFFQKNVKNLNKLMQETGISYDHARLWIRHSKELPALFLQGQQLKEKGVTKDILIEIASRFLGLNHEETKSFYGKYCEVMADKFYKASEKKIGKSAAGKRHERRKGGVPLVEEPQPKQSYKKTLQKVVDMILNHDFKLHGKKTGVPIKLRDYGKTSTEEKHISYGAYQALSTAYDLLKQKREISSEEMCQACQEIYKHLKDKRSTTLGLFGYGRRDKTTVELYKEILVCLDKYITSPSHPITFLPPGF